ncbi:MFS transporter [Actinocrinis puniceicyclus]|uniref:MFS transporter n=1 Tax=Actinocrinis puniceicyclus TaxID=977794 RepID=A0A8J8BBW6_9ACTN|nr:MFS transporter [Actinocrinis puniceicyclus]MBS2963548.1 MFS transporter [Actinocrinis puniceicyclus]
MTETPRTPPPSALGARLDRLRFGRRHTVILLALGAGWMFDSFEVQLFSNAIGPLGDHFHASVFERDAVLAVWLGGILLGALAGGALTDRFGRRRMFVLTLLWYAGFTVLTGLSPDLAAVYALRFLAALGVGAEYAIVNAAIAEFMPARVRGKAAVAVMNFWPLGAILAALLAYLLLDTFALASATSWRYLFVLGGLLALVVLYYRRRIPESPRWLASHGRVEEAERIVADLESAEPAHEVRQSAVTGVLGPAPAPPPPQLPVTTALRELVRRHPGRLALGAALDLAEAFGYYGIFALLSVVVLTKVHIRTAQIPFFYILGNLGALAGGLIASLLLDRAGRRGTVAGAYLAAAAGVGLLAWATATGSAAWVTAAFVVSNGAATAAWTSAYPTFTELFPTHLRGAGIGVSVSVGRIGAIVGTLLLPDLATRLGATASYLLVIGFWLIGVGAIGLYALRGGQEAAGRPLESLVPVPAPAAAGA